MAFLFREFLFRPLFNALVFLYNIIPGDELGVAIIVLTVIIRFIFVPLSIKAIVSQRKLTKLQPKIKELQEKHKGNTQALSQATMALYKEHNVNPFSGCLPMLVQLPVIIALYRVFISGFEPENLNLLYSFVSNPGQLKEIAFGFLNLAENNHIMAVLAGAAQAIQARNSLMYQKKAAGDNPQDNPALKMSRQMLYFFPILIVVISWNFPAGLVLYWISTTVFSIFEQMYVNSKHS